MLYFAIKPGFGGFANKPQKPGFGGFSGKNNLIFRQNPLLSATGWCQNVKTVTALLIGPVVWT